MQKEHVWLQTHVILLTLFNLFQICLILRKPDIWLLFLECRILPLCSDFCSFRSHCLDFLFVFLYVLNVWMFLGKVTSDFLISISAGWVMMFLDGIYISQLVRFARCCTCVFDFHSKSFQITSKLWRQGYRLYKVRKTLGKFFRSYAELLSKFGEISFQEYGSKGISPVFN